MSQLQCAIVGLPNVGKSTLFGALTKAKAEAANYPFCTIDPNIGIVEVPDPRMKDICNHIKPDSVVPTTLKIVDVAGLVKGASKGEGLGNQFLSHIRETDAILHAVRCFEDENIVHVEGKINPLEDIETVELELILSDLETLQNRLTRIDKKSGTLKDKELLLEVEILKGLKAHLEDNKKAISYELSKEEAKIIKSLNLLTLKPFVYLCNIAESDIPSPLDNPHVVKVQEFAKSQNSEIIPICSLFESELNDIESHEDRLEFLEAAGLKKSGLDVLIQKAYEKLGLISFFTAGPKEVRAWTVVQGSLAPTAAGKIHSDIERGFIRAETYHYNDLTKHKNEAALKSAGKIRSEGKDYVVQDGDVIFFKFNV